MTIVRQQLVRPDQCLSGALGADKAQELLKDCCAWGRFGGPMKLTFHGSGSKNKKT